MGCYHLSNSTMMFGAAVDYCVDLESHLAYITSPEEQEVIEVYVNVTESIDCKYFSTIPVYSVPQFSGLYLVHL